MSNEIYKNNQQTYELLHIANQDLGNASFYADYLLERKWFYEPWDVESNIYLHQSAYVTSMVVAYSRPFIKTRGWPNFPTRILKALNKQQKELHDRILDQRTLIYAHSDIGSRNIRPLLYDGEPNATESCISMRFDEDDLILFRTLTTEIGIEMEKERKKLITLVETNG